VLVALLVACNAPPAHKLPGATPAHFVIRMAPPLACGDLVALDGDTSPDLTYAYSYDRFGDLVHATGVFAAGGPPDLVDQTYDNLGHTTHALETREASGARIEQTFDYDTLGELVDYTFDQQWPGDHQQQAYVFSDFIAAGPTHETLTQLGGPAIHYTLAYDASNRLADIQGDDGSTTTYTYDDEATHAVTMDSNHGAYVEQLVYDDREQLLSDSYDGDAPTQIAGGTTYTWDGDRLLGATMRSGSSAAPKQLATIEVDTLRYDCSDAR
jgi:hypothetical protein